MVRALVACKLLGLQFRFVLGCWGKPCGKWDGGSRVCCCLVGGVRVPDFFRHMKEFSN